MYGLEIAIPQMFVGPDKILCHRPCSSDSVYALRCAYTVVSYFGVAQYCGAATVLRAQLIVPSIDGNDECCQL